jgi:hypothetical protein
MPKMTTQRIVLLIACQAVAFGQAILWERQTTAAYSQGILVDKQQFDEGVIESLAREFVQTHKSKLISVLTLYTNRQQMFYNQKPSHLFFNGWLSNLGLLRRAGADEAQLIRLDQGAVLRIRAGATVTTRLIGGMSNPLDWEVDGRHFQILHVAVTNSSLFPIRVFAKALQPISESGVALLFERMNEKCRGEITHLSVREDPWFAQDIDFPVNYAFDLTEPPTYEGWSSLPAVRCGAYPQGTICNGS